MATLQIPIEDILPRRQYTAAPAQSDFIIPFYLFATSDISVFKTPVGQSANDNKNLLTLNVDYTVTLNGGDVGGTVSLLVACAGGELITLVRSMPDQRLNFYTQGGPFNATILNTDVQSLVLMLQQAKLYDQNISPRYNLTDNPVLPGGVPNYYGGDMILPVLGANQAWVKSDDNTQIEAKTIAAIDPGRDFVTYIPPSVPNVLTFWSDTEGLLASSTIGLNGGNNLTNVNTANIGNIRLTGSAFRPLAGNSLFTQANHYITTGNALRLNNADDTFAIGLKAPALAQDFDYTMPLLPPTDDGQALVSTMAGQWSWIDLPTGNVRGPVAPTTIRAIPVWGNTNGTLILNSLATIDDFGGIQTSASIAGESFVGGSVVLYGPSALNNKIILTAPNGLAQDYTYTIGEYPPANGYVWSSDTNGNLTWIPREEQRTITQVAHGFSVNQAIRVNPLLPLNYELAQADDLINSQAVGIVIQVIDVNTFVLGLNGHFNTGGPFLSGRAYYLDPTVAGGITTNRPAVNGQVIKPLFNTDSVGSGYINIGTSIIVAGGGGGGNVNGPGASTDRALARWDGATGTALFDSSTILDDANNLTGLNSVTIGNLQFTQDGTNANITSLGPNGRLNLIPGAAGTVNCQGPFILQNSNPIQWSDGVNSVTLGIGNALTGSATYKWPTALPNTFKFLGSDNAGSFSFSTITATELQVTAANHGFVLGNIIGINNAGALIKASARNAALSEVLGIVSEVLNVNTFILLMQGYISGLAGLAAGAMSYLNYDPNPVNDGTLVNIDGAAPGQVSKPLLLALSAGSGIFNNQRGQVR